MYYLNQKYSKKIHTQNSKVVDRFLHQYGNVRSHRDGNTS
jgi:hypothetical protein